MRKRFEIVVSCAAAWLVADASPLAARAGGYFVGENGAQALSRGGATTASVDDATAIYLNPAGLARADHTEIYFGFNLLDMNESYQREGSYSGSADPYPKVQNQGPPLPIPFLAVNVPLGRLALAGGLFFPAGYAGGDFGENVTTASGVVRPAPQRYDIVSTGGLMAMPSAAAAYRVTDNLSLGARFSAVWISTTAVAYGQVIPNDAEDKLFDARSAIQATDNFTPQLGVGAHYTLGSLELAAAYTSQLHFDLKGTTKITFSQGVTLQVQPVPDAQARCAPGGKVGALKTCISVTQFPQTGTLGARWVSRDLAGKPRGDLELDVRWENWSADKAEDVVIDGEDAGVRVPDKSVPTGFHDSWSIRFGGSRTFAKDYVVRAGAAYDTAPAPLSWTRLTVNGSPAFTFAGGLGIGFSSWRLDAGFAYVFSPPRVVQDVPVGANGAPVQPTIETFSNGTTPFNAGRYERSFAIGTVGATIWFGKGRKPTIRPSLDVLAAAPPDEPHDRDGSLAGDARAGAPADHAEPPVAPITLTRDDIRKIVREELARRAAVDAEAALVELDDSVRASATAAAAARKRATAKQAAKQPSKTQARQ